MLNIDTKRRIDSARDILVGKVPDPKAQVEQITTALIYKFMDDIDKESEELGGQASFFVDRYKQYAWSKLLDSRLGGFDRLNLYVEALAKMPQNPHLPQLFRDIFKDAFLPYRDPETLNLFLKEINSFTYEHSEKLGDAFEYLLSILGSQGDAGQFRTPRHISDFIVEVVDPKKDETVLDPACGTAGFLISSYKHILKQNTIHRLGDQLTPDEKTKLMQHFVGYDISPDMVKLSLVNMYLHSFPNPNVFEYDTLTSEERWDERYDVIMANPPFMTPKGGIRPHKRFSIQANRSEVLFVDYIAEHLTIHGRGGVIVPEGIIFQSGGAYQALRKMLVEKYLFAVVSLPAGIFQPYSGVKTSILLMDKQLAKKSKSILFVKVENDGFDLGAQRRVIEKNDLTEALCILQKYKQALMENSEVREMFSDEEEPSLVTIVEKTKIAKNGEYNLTGRRYREDLVIVHHKWPIVELGNEEYFQIEAGGTPDSQNTDYWDGKINWATLVDLPSENLITEITDTKRKISDKGLQSSSAKLLPENSILVSSRATIGRVAINKVELATNQGFKNIIIKNFDSVNPSFVAYMMTLLVKQMENLASGGTFKEISKTNFSTLKIPLPPLKVQQEIVAELEGYQKIIDGAKQVVECYKPTIKIDPTWEISDFTDHVFFQEGPGIRNWQFTTSGIKLLNVTNIVNGKMLLDNTNKYISEVEFKQKYSHFLVEDGDIILASSGNSWGKTGIFEDPGYRVIVNTSTIRLHSKNENKLRHEYLFLYLNSDNFRSQIQLLITGAAQPNFGPYHLKQVKIPLPPGEIQNQIVAQIEQEQKRVQATQELVEIFEQKIKDKIAEVWGTDITPNDDNNASSNGTSRQPQPVQRAVIEQAELGLA